MDEESRSWRAIGAAEGNGGTSPSLLDRLRRDPSVAVGMAVLAAVAIAVVGLWLAASASSPRVEFAALTEGATGGSSDGSSDGAVLIVDVAGAVRSPGLYRLPVGARVGDAITAAGGFGPAVDVAAATGSINLAARLSDGQKIVVPTRGVESADGAVTSGPALVDLNRASQAELEALPGIGPVTATKIIAARAERPFERAEELLERKIVGPATWEKLRDLVTAG